MVLGQLPVPGRPTLWMIVGQGPTALAVGAGGAVWTFFFSSIFLSSFSHSLAGGSIQTEILSQKAVKPKTTNQPTNQPAFSFNILYIGVGRGGARGGQAPPII